MYINYREIYPDYRFKHNKRFFLPIFNLYLCPQYEQHDTMKKIQLTDTHKEKLFQIPLFRNLPLNIKESLLEKLDFVVYIANKKEIVVTQGTPCNKLYVLLEGKLRTDIIDGLGNEVMTDSLLQEKSDTLCVARYIKCVKLFFKGYPNRLEIADNDITIHSFKVVFGS